MKQNELRIGLGTKSKLNGGLNYLDESTISESQSPFGGLLNMCLDDGGMPVKRQGQAFINQSLGDKGITNIFCDFRDYIVFIFNNKVYRTKLNTIPVEIYSGVSDNVCVFAFNSILYALDGSKFLQFDGTTMKEVVPYIPRVSMNRKADGSQSEVDESWNVIGRGFKNTFNGDGTSKVYRLSFNTLDADIVVCNVGGTEGNG
ncbi:MAG: hypothetical protein ACRC3Y_00370, partial [Romboutsia sp.]|uniref:hypothetical protein n=1 Tax=Romboutsia sp. TaxID=1965302 RepID=UPI003F3800F0